MIRVTSATYSATCPDCRDKSALNLTTPCTQHLAAAQGLHGYWRPIRVAAWSAATLSLAAQATQPADLWKPFR